MSESVTAAKIAAVGQRAAPAPPRAAAAHQRQHQAGDRGEAVQAACLMGPAGYAREQEVPQSLEANLPAAGRRIARRGPLEPTAPIPAADNCRRHAGQNHQPAQGRPACPAAAAGPARSPPVDHRRDGCRQHQHRLQQHENARQASDEKGAGAGGLPPRRYSHRQQTAEHERGPQCGLGIGRRADVARIDRQSQGGRPADAGPSGNQRPAKPSDGQHRGCTDEALQERDGPKAATGGVISTCRRRLDRRGGQGHGRRSLPGRDRQHRAEPQSESQTGQQDQADDRAQTVHGARIVREAAEPGQEGN